jgi:hypothetical protein
MACSTYFMRTPYEMDMLEKQRDDLMVRLAEAEDEASALRAAIRRTLQENKHLADGETCTLWRLKKAIGMKSNDLRQPPLPADGNNNKQSAAR